MSRIYRKYAALKEDLCQDQMTMSTQYNYHAWDHSPCQTKQSYCQKLLLHFCSGTVATLSVRYLTIRHSCWCPSWEVIEQRNNKKIDNRGYCRPSVVSNMHRQLNDGNPLVMTTFCENQHEDVSCPSATKMIWMQWCNLMSLYHWKLNIIN